MSPVQSPESMFCTDPVEGAVWARDDTKPTICSSRGQCRTISSKPKPVFFAVFDSLVAITTHPGVQNSRSGRFRVNDDDDDDNNRQTKRLLYPLLRMRARGNKHNSQRYHMHSRTHYVSQPSETLASFTEDSIITSPLQCGHSIQLDYTNTCTGNCVVLVWLQDF